MTGLKQAVHDMNSVARRMPGNLMTFWQGNDRQIHWTEEPRGASGRVCLISITCRGIFTEQGLKDIFLEREAHMLGTVQIDPEKLICSHAT